MKIAVIGSGFTGLSASYHLLKNNHQVTIFEKESLPGGLALGFKSKNWQWSLEAYYHHLFTNDKSILNLAKEINYEVVTQRPKTSIYTDGTCTQLDSPKHLLSFSKLSFLEKIRMGLVLGILRYNPFWKILESTRASEFLPKFMGSNAYQMIWEPQLVNKFGDYASEISMSWFWARIKKRTSSLIYPAGGFLSFAKALVEHIEKNGGKFLFDTDVKEITGEKNVQVKFSIENQKVKIENYDAVIVTLPSLNFIKIAQNLPKKYINNLKNLKGLGANNLVLRLKKPFLQDGTYWLSICDKKSPIMAIVEHTNFMNKKYYDNEHLVYLGNYLSIFDPRYKMTKEQLLKSYHPFLKKINNNYDKTLIDYHLFNTPFAQPIIPVNYQKIMPSFVTPLKNVYLANIQQIYPWDRGTNYAVELGEKISELIQNQI